MSIDWTISLGNIVSTALLVGTLIGIAINFGKRFTLMERKVNLMFGWFLKQLNGKSQLTPNDIAKFFDVEPKG